MVFFRKRVLLPQLHNASKWTDELYLIDLILSKHPKRAALWAHRAWLVFSLGNLTQDRIQHEWRICDKACDRHRMNYNAWTYRCKLLAAVDNVELLMGELKRVAIWIRAHVSDHSAYAYRRAALVRLRDLYRRDVGEEAVGIAAYSCLLEAESDLAREIIDKFPGHASPWSYLRDVCYMQMTEAEMGGDSEERNVLIIDEMRRASQLQTELPIPPHSTWLSAIRYASRIAAATEEMHTNQPNQRELALAFLYAVYKMCPSAACDKNQDVIRPIGQRLIDLDYCRSALIEQGYY